jgi:Tfp pilus assembly protein PilO
MSPADFLRQLWSGHRLLVAVTGLLLVMNLVLALILNLYLVPTVNGREQQLRQRQSEWRGGAVSDESPAQLLADGERDLGIFAEKIPPYREFTGLIVELQEMADGAGLELGQVSYKNDRQKDSDLLRYTLTFTVAGAYRDIKQFVHALEQSPRLLILREIGLQGVGENDQETDVRLQLSLETFFRPGVP